jgi:nicotinate-nucleotide pyrophosphorylase (carboxylating)
MERRRGLAAERREAHESGVEMRLPDVSKSAEVKALIRRALDEDVGGGDATTLALVPAGATARARVLSRGSYVVSGAAVAALVFRAVEPRLRVRVLVPDGKRVGPGQAILSVAGPARGILTAERTALNFLQRMTGIATLTSRFVEQVKRHGTLILDTRKTTPGLRALEKYAVLCGGGSNHRMGLFDRILIKDNHRHFWRRAGRPQLDRAVSAARARFPGLSVEVEVENARELTSALAAQPEWVLLDNMSPARLRACVRLCAGRARIEASGGITLGNAARVAAAGVDAISLGCLTHSAPAADLSLEMAAETAGGSDA